MSLGRTPRKERLSHRPKSLRWFGWLVLLSTSCNVLAILLIAGRFRADAIASGQAAAGWFVGICLVIALNGLLWWRIARRGGNFARWIYIVLTASSLLQVPSLVTLSGRYGLVYGGLMAASLLAAIAAASLLLRKDAGDWLSGQTSEEATAPRIFE